MAWRPVVSSSQRIFPAASGSASMKRSLSEVEIKSVIMSPFAWISPSRRSDITLSITWASLTIGSNPKKPAAPLML